MSVVSVGDRYDVTIGRDLLDQVADVLPEQAEQVLVVHSEALPGPARRVAAAITGSGRVAHLAAVPDAEAAKTATVLSDLWGQLGRHGFTRTDAIVAVGGGTVTDLGGFLAASWLRGVPVVQVPTTLLAMVDAAVGGKTGINTGHGKNLVGQFNQPRLVLADTAALDTLPAREFRAGYAEVVKYGLIDQPDFFTWLEARWTEIFAGGEARIEAIARSCQAKADVVARDEFETGDRALLNLGHTFGHALEAATGYDGARLVHGEGVAIGMALAHRFSARLNLASPDDADRVEAHLRAVGLPWRLSDVPGELPDAERLLSYIAQDKKVTRGALTFILTRGIGQAFIARDVPSSEVLAFLTENRSK